jgi:hypothetical protein
MDGQEDFGATGEVLDIAVSAVFGAAGDCACAFFADFFLQISRRGTSVYVLRLRGFGDGAVEMGVCSDEFAFALVPKFEDFLRWRAA